MLDTILQNKELLLMVLGFVWELIARRKPGWKPPTKMVYDIFGQVIEDKPTKK